MRRASASSITSAPFESLEPRLLMANTPLAVTSYVVTGGYALLVTGSTGDDTIHVNRTGTTVTITNGTWTWSRAGTWIALCVKGGLGNDAITMGTYALPTTLYGGAGNDTINGGAGKDFLLGEAGNDVVSGGANNDRVDGGVGNDVMAGGDGADLLDYASRLSAVSISFDGVDNDGMAGETDAIGSEFEIVYAGGGHDTITGGGNNDSLFGFAGNDVITGGAGADSIDGGVGNDTVTGNEGADVLLGSAGNDSLVGGVGKDTIDGGAGADALLGGDDDDKLTGGTENDTLYGNGGNDHLYGGVGNDQLNGNEGDDTLVALGGGSFDAYNGGAGYDAFWTDPTEIIADVEANETAGGTVHRVTAFASLKGVAVSKELSGQNLTDPTQTTTAYKYRNFRTNALFADGGPSANDVWQGAVGDCYFLAPLSSVAGLNPNRIRQSIVDLGDGTYAVQFNKGTTKVFVRIDADLPTYSWGAPAYAKFGAQSSLWVALVEKAYTFFRRGSGTYASISSGWMSECYWALGLSHANGGGAGSGSVLAELMDAELLAGKSVSLGTHGTTAVGSNLIGGHAYSVTAVHRDGNGVAVSVTVRNPWGYDGTGNDGANDGYVTVAVDLLLASMSGWTVSLV